MAPQTKWKVHVFSIVFSIMNTAIALFMNVSVLAVALDFMSPNLHATEKIQRIPVLVWYEKVYNWAMNLIKSLIAKITHSDGTGDSTPEPVDINSLRHKVLVYLSPIILAVIAAAVVVCEQLVTWCVHAKTMHRRLLIRILALGGYYVMYYVTRFIFQLVASQFVLNLGLPLFTRESGFFGGTPSEIGQTAVFVIACVIATVLSLTPILNFSYYRMLYGFVAVVKLSCYDIIMYALPHQLPSAIKWCLVPILLPFSVIGLLALVALQLIFISLGFINSNSIGRIPLRVLSVISGATGLILLIIFLVRSASLSLIMLPVFLIIISLGTALMAVAYSNSNTSQLFDFFPCLDSLPYSVSQSTIRFEAQARSNFWNVIPIIGPAFAIFAQYISQNPLLICGEIHPLGWVAGLLTTASVLATACTGDWYWLVFFFVFQLAIQYSANRITPDPKVWLQAPRTWMGWSRRQQREWVMQARGKLDSERGDPFLLESLVTALQRQFPEAISPEAIPHAVSVINDKPRQQFVYEWFLALPHAAIPDAAIQFVRLGQGVLKFESDEDRFDYIWDVTSGVSRQAERQENERVARTRQLRASLSGSSLDQEAQLAEETEKKPRFSIKRKLAEVRAQEMADFDVTKISSVALGQTDLCVKHYNTDSGFVFQPIDLSGYQPYGIGHAAHALLPTVEEQASIRERLGNTWGRILRRGAEANVAQLRIPAQTQFTEAIHGTLSLKNEYSVPVITIMPPEGAAPQPIGSDGSDSSTLFTDGGRSRSGSAMDITIEQMRLVEEESRSVSSAEGAAADTAEPGKQRRPSRADFWAALADQTRSSGHIVSSDIGHAQNARFSERVKWLTFYLRPERDFAGLSRRPAA